MNLTKLEKTTLATALAIFEDHLSEPDNEVSKREPFITLFTLSMIRSLIKKLELEEVWKEIHEKDE